MTKYILFIGAFLYFSVSSALAGNQCAQSLEGGFNFRDIQRHGALEIVNAPDSKLNRVSSPVPEEILTSPEFQEFLTKMVSMRKSSGGVGLAAPQVGVLYQVAVVRPETKKQEATKVSGAIEEEDLILINPIVTPLSRDTGFSREGCLSIKDIRKVVARFREIRVDFLDRNGHRHSETFDGRTAIIIQHEVDHLNGVLFPEISQFDLWKIGLRQASRLDSVDRKNLLRLFQSLTDQQRREAKPLREKIRRDILQMDRAGTAIYELQINSLNSSTDQNSRSFFDDLMSYYELRLTKTLNAESLNQWIRTEAHARYVVEDLEQTGATDLASIFPEVVTTNPHLQGVSRGHHH